MVSPISHSRNLPPHLPLPPSPAEDSKTASLDPRKAAIQSCKIRMNGSELLSKAASKVSRAVVAAGCWNSVPPIGLACIIYDWTTTTHIEQKFARLLSDDTKLQLFVQNGTKSQ